MNDQSCAEGNHHVIVGQKYLVKSATRRFATRIRDRRRIGRRSNKNDWFAFCISFKLAQSHFCLYSKKYEFFNYKKFSNIIKKDCIEGNEWMLISRAGSSRL